VGKIGCICDITVSQMKKNKIHGSAWVLHGKAKRKPDRLAALEGWGGEKERNSVLIRSPGKNYHLHILRGKKRKRKKRKLKEMSK